MKNRQPIIEDPIVEPFTERMPWHKSDGFFGIDNFLVDNLPYDRAQDLLLEVIMKVKRIKGAHPVDEILTTTSVVDKLRTLAIRVSGVSEDRCLFLKPDKHRYVQLCGINVTMHPSRKLLAAHRRVLESQTDKIIVELV